MATQKTEYDHIETAISIVYGATCAMPSEFAMKMMLDRADGGNRYSRQQRAQMYAENAIRTRYQH